MVDLLCWSILLKIDRELYFLKVDRFFVGNVNMAKTYERVLPTNTLQEQKRGTRPKPEV